MKKILTLICTLLCANVLMAQTRFIVGELQYEVTEANNVKVHDCMPSATSIVIPDTVTYQETNYCVTSIGAEAFKDCSNLTSVTIPNSVTFIGDSAFWACVGLTSIDIPNGVTSIGESVFSRCSSLTSVTIPNSVTSIGWYAFDGCSSLTSVDIPNSVTSIGWYAFNGCSSLTSVTIPNSVTSIGFYAFDGCSSLTSVDIPNSVTSIGQGVFSDCSSLTSIDIPNSVTFIGVGAFCGCDNLTSVTIPNSVTFIGGAAFQECKNLTSINIPNGITSIEFQTFLNCSSLASIDIPNSVTSIGNNAFENCSSLTSVTIPNSVTSIGNGAFRDCNYLLSVFLPTNADISSSAFSNAGSKIIIDSITYEKTTSSLTIGFNVLFDVGFTAFYMGGNVYKNPATGVTIIDCETSKSGDVIIPPSIRVNYIENPVTSIGFQAFGDCDNLTSVTIPNSVTAIGKLAFGGCDSLISVTIPNSVTYIEEGTFMDCRSLTSVIIPNSVTAIGYENNYWGVFEDCRSLASVTIGNSVTTIGDWAFYNCSSLTSITIPSSVTYIGAAAFKCQLDQTSVGYENIPSNLAVVTCLASTPPYARGAFHDWMTWPLPQAVYVPCGSLEAYINSDKDWGNDFWNVSGLTSVKKIHEITYDIDATANNEVFGSVAVESDCPSATLTATANEGFAFLSWNDGNTDNPRIVSLSSDTAFTAYFGTTIIYDTICQGSTYEENNFNETEQGLYTQTTTDANGQDSVTVLSLTVNPIFNTELTATICQGQAYTENNFNVSEAGVYTQTLTAVNGCDSIVTLTLNVNPIYNTELTATICEGSVYTENGFNVSEAGVYMQTLTAVNGCDSIVTLTLNVNPIYNTELTATICEGSVYTENNFNVSEAGVYTQNLTSVNGCDSIVTLTLNVNPIFNTELSATICEGQVYTENGFNVSEAGVYTQILTAVNGCDSIVTLNLNVNPIYNTELTASICEGQVYTENGFYVSEAGVYTQTLTSANGCDSIVTLTLNVNPIFNTELSANICQGQVYNENGFNVSDAGVYTQTLQTVNGCDSIVTLTLNVNPIYNTELTATICEGSVYTENNFNVSEAGVYTQTLTSVNGCDSIVTLTLNVNPIYHLNLSTTICEGYSIDINGFNVSEAGTFTQTFTAMNGCDSVVTLTVVANPRYETELTATICEGQVYTENGFNVSEAGVYTQTLQTINGCDSIVTLTLNVNPIFNTELTATICEGQTYTENGFNVSEAGVYTQTLTSVNGCDSIVTLTLNVNPIYNTELSATICEGQVYTENNFNVSEAGVYTQTLQTINGCDSIVTLTLNVNPIYNTELTATICQGQVYTENGFNVSEAGVYTQTLQTINGCDSIVTLTLNVNPIYNTELTAIICEGSVYTENGFNVSEAGVYTQTLTSVNGCDSIVTLTLNVNPIYNINLSTIICEGYSVDINGLEISEAGVYTQNLTSVNGCDSIVTLTVSVNPTFDTTINATINPGETYAEFGFNESEAGTYVQNLQTVNGCDSTITLILDVNSSLMDVEHSELSFYPNPTKSEITFSQAIERIEVIDLTGRCVLTFSNAREINIESLPSGAYYLRLTNNDKAIMRKVIKQ